jgi:hypothetical protein
MATRLIQILLVVSIICGASAQALACVPMMQSGDHACCRIIMVKKATSKLRAAQSSHQTPVKSSHCCNSNTPSPQQTPAEQKSSSREETAVLANNAGNITISVKKVVPFPVKSLAPPGYSPPHFILYRSMLI